MFCTKCSDAIPDHADYCKRCGSKVEESNDGILATEANNTRSTLRQRLTVCEPLSFAGVLAWTAILVSVATMTIGILLFVLTSAGFFEPGEVSLKELQEEMGKKTPVSVDSVKIDGLRSHFTHLDDERWIQAKELINGWVENWSGDPTEKSRFVDEIKITASKFPQEQRSAAVDTLYRLKQEKRREAGLRQQSSWLLQLGTPPSITISLIVFGIFSMILALIRIEKNTRGIETTKQSSV